jgi:uncharacterized protein
MFSPALALATSLALGQATPAPIVDPSRLPGTITVTGTGEARGRPDSVTLTFGVTTINASLSEARAENNTRMQAARAAVQRLNIPNLTLQTSNITVTQQQVPDNEQRGQAKRAFYITNQLFARVRRADPDRLADYAARIVDAALGAGGNELQGVFFSLDDDSALRREAMTKAVKDAMTTIETLAAAANVRTSRILSIDTTGGGPRPFFGAMARMEAAAAGAPPTPVEAGDVTVSLTVNITAQIAGAA